MVINNQYYITLFEMYHLKNDLYVPALGRFLSVDSLFEAYPGQSPYAYAFNSPMQWRDPTGMAPVKEKRRDRILVYLGEAETSQAMGNTADDYLSLLSVPGDPLDHNAMYSYGMSDEFHWLATGGQGIGTPGGGSGSAGGGRTGWDGAANGQIRFVDDQQKTMIHATDGNSQSAIKKCVEDDYEQYIDFNEKGFIQFTIDEATFNKIRDNNPNSNFLILYDLAYNSKELVNVSVVDGAKDLVYFQDNNHQYSSNLFDRRCSGITFPPKSTNSSQYFSINKSTDCYISFYNPLKINYHTEQTVAHEILFHAYMFYKTNGRDSGDDNNPKNLYFIKRIERNALRKR